MAEASSQHYSIETFPLKMLFLLTVSGEITGTCNSNLVTTITTIITTTTTITTTTITTIPLLVSYIRLIENRP